MVEPNTKLRDGPPSSVFPLVISVSSAALGLVLLSLHRRETNSADGNSRDGDIYHTLGIRPPHNATKNLWLGPGIMLPLARWSWNIHGRLLPLLHFFEERPRTGDVFVNLRVVWCKFLSSLDPESPAYEGEPPSLPWKDTRYPEVGVGTYRDGDKWPAEDNQQQQQQQQLEKLCYATYRMLPPYSIKWPLRYLGLWRIFPRWMHANIEVRTAYLQAALKKVLGQERQYNSAAREDTQNQDDSLNGTQNSDKAKPTENICVIVLGAGYDPTGAKLLSAASRYNVHDSGSGNRSSVASVVPRFVVYELDLPPVMDSKRRLLRRAGFAVADTDTTCRSGSSDAGESSIGLQRGENSHDKNGIHLEGVDLNDDAAVDKVLDLIRKELIDMVRTSRSTDYKSSSQNSYSGKDNSSDSLVTSSSNNNDHRWRVVLISEAVLMYLDPGKAERILEGVAERFHHRESSKSIKDTTINTNAWFHDASFIFADRLVRRRNRPSSSSSSTSTSTTTSTKRDPFTMLVPATPELIDAEESEVRRWLRERGWDLNELLFKPGSTRHLGIASTISTC